MKKLLAIVMLCGIGLVVTSAFSDATAPTNPVGVCIGPVCANA